MPTDYRSAFFIKSLFLTRIFPQIKHYSRHSHRRPPPLTNQALSLYLCSPSLRPPPSLSMSAPPPRCCTVLPISLPPSVSLSISLSLRLTAAPPIATVARAPLQPSRSGRLLPLPHSLSPSLSPSISSLPLYLVFFLCSIGRHRSSTTTATTDPAATV